MRIALAVEYDGSRFHGWQKQPNKPTVQAYLEKALSLVAAETIAVFCAGRTDAGVHATTQIVHFETNSARPLKAWVMGTNGELPFSIRVLWAQPMAEDFHARFSALARRYCYVIYNSPVRPAINAAGLSWSYHPLDETLMHNAGQFLLGEQDFTSFRAHDCQSNSPFRCVDHLKVYRKQELVVIDIKANAFLHHMVRNITGVLLAIGHGNKPTEWAHEVLLAKDRRAAGPTALPQGLYLVGVDYPEQYNLPTTLRLPLFI